MWGEKRQLPWKFFLFCILKLVSKHHNDEEPPLRQDAKLQ